MSERVRGKGNGRDLELFIDALIQSGSPRHPDFGYARLCARLALKQLPHKIGRPACGLKGTVSGLPH